MSLEHWVWLSCLQIDRRSLHTLLDYFVEPQRVYEATARELEPVRLSRGARDTVLKKHDLKEARAILSQCEKAHIRVVTMQDAAYPERLRNIEQPPVLLYVGGQLPSFDEEAAIAVVGTRKSSETAENIAYTFGYELAEKGMLVISGMAMGIDTAANAGALAAGARTVAVLGCGIDVCYPASSRPIYDMLLSGKGCLISEYPPGTGPLARHFPERNRIISGLAAGVLVVAAPAKSGALITANRALEQGREIFVVPGGIQEEEYAGSNALIKSGAIPVTTPKDIVAYYYGRFPDAFDPERVSSYMQSRTEAAEQIRLYRRPVVLQAASRPAYGAEDRQTPVREERPSRARQLLQLFSRDRRDADRGERVTEVVPVKQPAELTLPAEFSEDHRRLAEILQKSADGTAHIDTLVNQSGLPAAEVLSMLTDLELEGIITALPGKRFQINK